MRVSNNRYLPTPIPNNWTGDAHEIFNDLLWSQVAVDRVVALRDPKAFRRVSVMRESFALRGPNQQCEAAAEVARPDRCGGHDDRATDIHRRSPDLIGPEVSTTHLHVVQLPIRLAGPPCDTNPVHAASHHHPVQDFCFVGTPVFSGIGGEYHRVINTVSA